MAGLPQNQLWTSAAGPAMPFRYSAHSGYGTRIERVMIAIPQEPYQPTNAFTPHPTIVYDPPINLAEAMAGKFLEDHRHELDVPAFAYPPRSQKVSVRLAIAGYPNWHEQMHIRGCHGIETHSITKGKLAEGIARRVDKFLKVHGKSEQHVLELDDMRFSLGDIFLRSVQHVSKGSIQPELVSYPTIVRSCGW